MKVVQGVPANSEQKKLNFENVVRFKLRWKTMMLLDNRSENQILLSNLATLMPKQQKKLCYLANNQSLFSNPDQGLPVNPVCMYLKS